MQPVMYGFPSAALPGHCFFVEHWLVNLSPTGNGCVFDRFAYFAAAPLSCGTFFSVMPRMGLPVSRLRMYTQPVFDAAPIAGVLTPLYGRSNRIGGFVTSKSQMSWWTVWKPHANVPELRCSATIESVQRL